jgi:hypothetical protein
MSVSERIYEEIKKLPEPLQAEVLVCTISVHNLSVDRSVDGQLTKLTSVPWQARYGNTLYGKN